jgi:hypothetical protein
MTSRETIMELPFSIAQDGTPSDFGNYYFFE